MSHRAGSFEARIISARLLAWYRKNRRDLPWRRSRDPYRIWISEVMLQQTQVATVIPFYTAFLRRFPTLQALAAAREEEVLAAWSGLGYYRRARNLHAAARAVEARHRGKFPRDFDALRRLPGVGRYTAGALGSIAFDLREPALDGNAERVLTRLLALPGDPRKAAVRNRLEASVRELMEGRPPAEVNQALMELGALLCRPVDPGCPQCALARRCEARRAGRQEAFPEGKARPPARASRAVVAILRKGERYLVRRRRDGEAMAGLWEFPGDLLLPDESRAAGVARVGRERLGRGIRAAKSLARFTQHITTRRIEVSAFEAVLSEPVHHYSAAPQSVRWLSPEAIRKLPHGSATARLLRILAERPSGGRRSARVAHRRTGARAP